MKLTIEPLCNVHHDGRRGRMLHVVVQGEGRSRLVGLEGWLPKLFGGPGGWYCLVFLKVKR